MEHEVGHGDQDHALAAFDKGFVVLGQSAILSQPREGAFHNPAFRQHHEAPTGMSLHNFHHAEVPTPRPMHERPGIPAVREDHLQAPEASAQLPNQQLGPIAILNICGMDRQGDDQTERIDDPMPLAALDFLPRVIPAIPPFSAVLTDWLSRMPTLGVGALPTFRRTCTRRRS